MTTPVVLSADTLYSIVVRSPNANSTSALYLWGAHDATYTGGCQSSSSSSGASWYNLTDYDKYFYVWGSNISWDNVNYSFWTNESGDWTEYGNGTIYENSTVYANNSFTEYETTYWWSINATDGTFWTNHTYHFTTTVNTTEQIVDTSINGSYVASPISEQIISTDINGSYVASPISDIVINTDINGSYTALAASIVISNSINGSYVCNSTPVFSDENPSDGSIIYVTSYNWSIMINDSGWFNWTLECSNDQDSNGTNDTTGTFYLNLSGLVAYTTYTVWLNVSNNFTSVNASYIFTVMPASSGTPGGGGWIIPVAEDDEAVVTEPSERAGSDLLAYSGALLITIYSIFLLFLYKRKKKKKR